MLLHINKFVDRVRAMESRPHRELAMSLAEARDLHADITKLLVIVQDLHERTSTTTTTQTVDIQVDGGNF